MTIEVPRLSEATTTAMKGLAAIKDAAAFDTAVRALPEAVKAELRTLDAILSKRLGPNVSPADQAALASVPDQQRRSFEAVRETLKTVSRVIDTDRSQRLTLERLAQSPRKDVDISR